MDSYSCINTFSHTYQPRVLYSTYTAVFHMHLSFQGQLIVSGLSHTQGHALGICESDGLAHTRNS